MIFLLHGYCSVVKTMRRIMNVSNSCKNDRNENVSFLKSVTEQIIKLLLFNISCLSWFLLNLLTFKVKIINEYFYARPVIETLGTY